MEICVTFHYVDRISMFSTGKGSTHYLPQTVLVLEIIYQSQWFQKLIHETSVGQCVNFSSTF